MGMWAYDQRQGFGVVVTVDGVYYEGRFNQNKLAVSYTKIPFYSFNSHQISILFIKTLGVWAWLFKRRLRLE